MCLMTGIPIYLNPRRSFGYYSRRFCNNIINRLRRSDIASYPRSSIANHQPFSPQPFSNVPTLSYNHPSAITNPTSNHQPTMVHFLRTTRPPDESRNAPYSSFFPFSLILKASLAPSQLFYLVVPLHNSSHSILIPLILQCSHNIRDP